MCIQCNLENAYNAVPSGPCQWHLTTITSPQILKRLQDLAGYQPLVSSLSAPSDLVARPSGRCLILAVRVRHLLRLQRQVLLPRRPQRQPSASVAPVRTTSKPACGRRTNVLSLPFYLGVPVAQWYSHSVPGQYLYSSRWFDDEGGAHYCKPPVSRNRLNSGACLNCPKRVRPGCFVSLCAEILCVRGLSWAR